MPPTRRIQSKVQVLQDQLNDSLGDLSMTRRREESLKAELGQAAAKLEGRTEELARAQVKMSQYQADRFGQQSPTG